MADVGASLRWAKKNNEEGNWRGSAEHDKYRELEATCLLLNSSLQDTAQWPFKRTTAWTTAETTTPHHENKQEPTQLISDTHPGAFTEAHNVTPATLHLCMRQKVWPSFHMASTQLMEMLGIWINY